MSEEEFGRIVEEEWDLVPEKFKERLQNVALLIDDEPSAELLEEEGIGESGTLLGIYQGIPLIERGSDYGVGGTLPDTITLFRLPIGEEAEDMGGGEASYRHVIRETIWHEIGHYFGLSEGEIHEREEDGTNRY